jgi:hypothetical protein
MDVHGSYMLVMLGRMVFGDIVTEVFGPWMPGDINILVADLVRDPKVSHFHCPRPLHFDGGIGDADCGVIVTVYWGRWLRVSHFFQRDAEDFDFFDV